MYIHSHLRTRRDIITFVYCTYEHMLKWPERFEDRLFTMKNMKHTLVKQRRFVLLAVLR